MYVTGPLIAEQYFSKPCFEFIGRKRNENFQFEMYASKHSKAQTQLTFNHHRNESLIHEKHNHNYRNRALGIRILRMEFLFSRKRVVFFTFLYYSESTFTWPYFEQIRCLIFVFYFLFFLKNRRKRNRSY